MYSLHLLLRASPAALLLILCLQLGTTKAQEDTASRQLMTMDLQMQIAEASEEATLVLKVSTELRECMVIKSYLLSNIPIEGSFNYKYTSCLCDSHPRSFFWDLQTNSTVRITAVVDVIRELGICPNDWAVIPIKANRFSITKSLP
nr:prolactin-inducible protein homolog [Odocoileus virginianus texanus]XP_020753205.1 prolactin-inducible protein homolog [Odocoileus virginianus texanus]XP_020753206.1 prolactin-inducible protein homolog [Odocoileus virginianus texanus]